MSIIHLSPHLPFLFLSHRKEEGRARGPWVTYYYCYYFDLKAVGTWNGMGWVGVKRPSSWWCLWLDHPTAAAAARLLTLWGWIFLQLMVERGTFSLFFALKDKENINLSSRYREKQQKVKQWRRDEGEGTQHPLSLLLLLLHLESKSRNAQNFARRWNERRWWRLERGSGFFLLLFVHCAALQVPRLLLALS